MECKVWSVKCGVGAKSVECGVWSGKCRGRCVECRVWSIK